MTVIGVEVIVVLTSCELVQDSCLRGSYGHSYKDCDEPRFVWYGRGGVGDHTPMTVAVVGIGEIIVPVSPVRVRDSVPREIGDNDGLVRWSPGLLSGWTGPWCMGVPGFVSLTSYL